MRFVFGLVFLSLIIQMQGQNLVPNPSFEICSQCPNSQDQLDRAVGWFKPTGNTSDYFNACFPDMVFGQDVPANFMGFQEAHSGSAYAGFASLGCPIGTQTECDVVSTDTVTIVVRNDCNTSSYSGIIFAPSRSDGNTFVYYNLSEIGTLEIYNMLGQLVWLDELPEGDRREFIYLPLAQGLYCWRVRNGDVYAGQGKIEIIQ